MWLGESATRSIVEVLVDAGQRRFGERGQLDVVVADDGDVLGDAPTRTWKLLPTHGHSVVIDVQHMVVGLLTLAMCGTTLAATLGG